MKEKIGPRVGVGVFVFKEGKVLLGKRKGDHGTGFWAPPGGHLEFGETVKECAIRELAEETGLKALETQTGFWIDDIGEQKHYVSFAVIVNQFEGELKLLEPDKCEGWEWFSVDDLPEPLFGYLPLFFEQYKKRSAPHEQVLASILEIYRERDWEKFHSPKNLVMDLASEAGELLDIFRWMTEEDSYHPDPKTLAEVRDEVADVFKAILYLSHKLKIDPLEASYSKLEKMKQKYPADKCRGKSQKYTAYETPNK